MLPLVCAAAALVGVSIFEFALIYRLRRYRTDLLPGQTPFSGTSMFWPINVLTRRNYAEDGRRLLPLLGLLMAFQALAAIATLGFIARIA